MIYICRYKTNYMCDKNKKIVIDSELHDEILEVVKGSCKSIHDNLIDSFDIDSNEVDINSFISLCNYIESEIFCCEWCGWWFDLGENHDHDGETLCSHCIDDVDDDD